MGLQSEEGIEHSGLSSAIFSAPPTQRFALGFSFGNQLYTLVLSTLLVAIDSTRGKNVEAKVIHSNIPSVI
jgi:hypothetical protein